MKDTKPLLMLSNFPAIKRKGFEILQVNLGYTCNLSCTHCHVNAGPNRTEQMSHENIEMILEMLSHYSIKTLDLTGGAPEMMPYFRRLVRDARAQSVQVIDRCNLTILQEENQEDLAEFLADNQVEVVASLPCYSEKNVDDQRGKGVFESSIEGLIKLNKQGYGQPGSGLILDLVYNPGGAFLPPNQHELEIRYKQELKQTYGICFNQLFTMTNMPIARFGAQLLAKGEFYSYMTLLKDNFSSANVDGLMCRTTLSVDWQGYVYDCDFNQMLDLPLLTDQKKRVHLRDLLTEKMSHKSIVVADHCYGCTAGQGSSCGGAIESA